MKLRREWEIRPIGQKIEMKEIRLLMNERRE
jgi:hypothetical protein